MEFVRSFESDGILERVDAAKAEAMLASEWGAVNPVCTIPKTSGGFRFLVDCKRSGANWQLLVKVQGVFLPFRRLPQGGRLSPACCLAFVYGSNEQWREDLGRDIVQGQVPGAADFDPSEPAVIFVDAEGRRDQVHTHIFGGRTFEEAAADEESFLKHVGWLGLHPKWKKRVIPTQSEADYGGFGIRTDMEVSGLQVRTKPGVADQLHSAALGALGAASNPATTLARLGGLAERTFSLNKAYRAWLARFYGFASRVAQVPGKLGWRRSLASVAAERKDMREIAMTAREDAC